MMSEAAGISDFELAEELVNQTSKNIFLTGKAGTGKTTFLKKLREGSSKQMVVVAPTGVAAMNAGGVTMHSFFQLPFNPFLPAGRPIHYPGSNYTDRFNLLKNLRLPGVKKQVMRELELLVIDEVSMVRADMLDAVDAILRHVRRRPSEIFGGVQVLFIGDLYQLAPVVTDHEWELLKQEYNSPFFFDARVMQEEKPLVIELKKIYRQADDHFISLLNRIRNGSAETTDLELLNSRILLDGLNEDDNIITLTSHNRIADAINEKRLSELPGEQQIFKAEVQGDFPEKNYPTDQHLRIKPGAQVMFIRNDAGHERRFYNGKLAIVKEVHEENITVAFDDGNELKLERETWKNVQYSYDANNGAIEEEELGSFRQFPLRLAWAITIHKSQGLTFDKLVIDAAASFAPGQVYVALSRCTSLDGLYLKTPLPLHAIRTDHRIVSFSKSLMKQDELLSILSVEKKIYQSRRLLQAFRITNIEDSLAAWVETIENKKVPDQQSAFEVSQAALASAGELAGIIEKFLVQVRRLLEKEDHIVLEERMNKAVAYISEELIFKIFVPVNRYLEKNNKAAKAKTYLAQIREMLNQVIVYLKKINSLEFGAFRVKEHEMVRKISVPNEIKTKKKKGDTIKETLELFRQGIPVAKIAEMRSLTRGTIESHLLKLLSNGDVQVEQLVDPQKRAAIEAAITQGKTSVSELKEYLPENFSYYEISAVVNASKLNTEKVA